MTVTIVRLGISNLGSVVNMLRHLGHDTEVVSDPAEIERSPNVVLPGVGRFDAGMEALTSSGLGDAICTQVANGGRLLGVCLGMQLLTKGSAEGSRPGLGLIDAYCDRLPSSEGPPRVRVPHVGWNSVRFSDDNGLVDPAEDWRFYFAHSYAVPSDAPDAVGWARHGQEFACAVRRGGVNGVQFHPEKSHRFGMRLLDGFLRGAAGAAA